MIDSFVALDLETTGISPASDQIIEIGMVRVVGGKVDGEYSRLVYPGFEIDLRITALTGITNDMVAGQPQISGLVPEILEFIGDLPLLGHNIIFDYGFLKKAVVNAGGTFAKSGIDTLKIARRILPPEQKKNLDLLCEYFGIDAGHSHRAFDDARSAMELYFKLYQVNPLDFGFEKAQELVFAVKKESPVTPAQKRYIRALLEFHNLDSRCDIDMLTKSQASKMIDSIIGEFGKLPPAY
ncbi:MAG: PolC-type DNA polymerase III [Lachnospiraceae bacterium]